MNKFLIFLMLMTPIIPAALEAQEEKGGEYKGWCARSAKAERIPPAEMEKFIRECMESLSDMDNDPDKAKRKKPKSEDG